MLQSTQEMRFSISPVNNIQEPEGMSVTLSSNIPSPATLDKSTQTQSAQGKRSSESQSGRAGSGLGSVSDNVSLTSSGDVVSQESVNTEASVKEVREPRELDAESALQALRQVSSSILQNADSSLRSQANQNSGSVADLLK